MAEVYASLIIKGKKKFSEVPQELKKQVEKILINNGREALLKEELNNN